MQELLMDSIIHQHPDWETPYFATIFTTQLSDALEGYDEASNLMAELVGKYDGFMGMHSARDQDGYGITVCYWKSEDSIKAWREDLEHQTVQSKGRGGWYSEYTIQIAEVKRSTFFKAV
jgi:heme-degrading monooxygenase HmoA